LIPEPEPRGRVSVVPDNPADAQEVITTDPSTLGRRGTSGVSAAICMPTSPTPTFRGKINHGRCWRFCVLQPSCERDPALAGVRSQQQQRLLVNSIVPRNGKD
jgi:hypothetical protein